MGVVVEPMSRQEAPQLRQRCRIPSLTTGASTNPAHLPVRRCLSEQETHCPGRREEPGSTAPPRLRPLGRVMRATGPEYLTTRSRGREVGRIYLGNVCLAGLDILHERSRWPERANESSKAFPGTNYVLHCLARWARWSHFKHAQVEAPGWK